MNNDLEKKVHKLLTQIEEVISGYDNLIKTWIDVLTNDSKSEKERIEVIVFDMKNFINRNKNKKRE